MSTRRANHNHTCKATGCTRQVSNKYLMCRQHWFQVPQHIKDQVWSTWHDVQETGQMTEAYAKAVRDAINAIGATNRSQAQSVNDFTEE